MWSLDSGVVRWPESMTKFVCAGYNGSVQQNDLVVLSCQSCLMGALIPGISLPRVSAQTSTKVPPRLSTHHDDML